jgi:transcriptional regulator with XRE-family HTH domain
MHEQQFTPQAIWGRELRFHRERAGFTQAELASRLYCSDSLISSIETGQAPATPEFAEAADEALNTDGVLLRQLDWRKGVPAYPTWFIDWIPMPFPLICHATSSPKLRRSGIHDRILHLAEVQAEHGLRR